ncbi:MAG: hypothetical protein ABS82_00605 [Rhodanobacter sp. SCN 67-45]|nr:MAG: hypothetical protein ABS82_00605 [Rhodanobacter sp. SCN 67-45]
MVGGHYTRHERVDGVLVPSGGLLTLTAVAPGIVSRVSVREGDKVHAGQALVEISGEQDSVSLGDTQAAIASQLQLKRNRLQADIVSQKHLGQQKQQELQTRLALIHDQIAQLGEEVRIQEQRANSSMTLYNEWSKYASSGIISKLQILQQHNTALDDLAQVKRLRGQALQLQQQATEIQGQLSQLPATTASKSNEIERQLADVAQALSQNAAQRAVVLRAPMDGTVANIFVHQGQAVAAQQSTATILPASSELRAELWVPTQAIGFIHAGEPVIMRYQAYPYQKFGQHLGRVLTVSRSAVSAQEVSRLLGQEIRNSRYRVQVALDGQSVLAYGQVEELKPGMTLDADVLLDRRRLIEWVFEPLAGFARPQGNLAVDRDKL